MEKFYGLAALVLLVSCSPAILNSQVISFDTNSSVSFFVDIANTPQLRTRGLMNVSFLPDDKGLLFVFDSSQELNFWMKDTLIPLDMIFIENDRVVDVITAYPCTSESCDIYSSRGDVVLEINGGLSKMHGISSGTRVVRKY